jgi:hypothetical protein
MKRVFMLAAACAAALAAAAPPASADVSTATYRCEADGRWTVYEVDDSDFAELTYNTGTATGTGCRRQQVTVEDDGSVDVELEEDFGFAGTFSWDLFGAELSESTAFAGTIAHQDGPERGVFTIVNGLVYAEIAGVSPNGSITGVTTHTGTGTCGDDCYTTHMVWVGTNAPTGL